MRSSNTKLDLRKNYPILFELGLIAALLIFIAAFKFHLPSGKVSVTTITVKEEPPIVLSPITKQEKPPIAPLRTPVPVEVPDDEPIEIEDISFPEFAYTDSALALPPKTENDDTPEVFDQVEFMPQLKGGIKALYRDINYPEMARRSGIEGMVEVRFVVNEKGEVENPEIIRGIGGGCDKEVLKAIKLQHYSPGIQNGILVKVKMKQVVHFRLNNK